jgi:O-methyltransferase involved in polyketide biosynthesis
MEKIRLTEEKETLLIPLFGKAAESEKLSPVLTDKKAAQIIGLIDYDFASLKIPDKTNVMMCIRAKLIDRYVQQFLAENGSCTALHLGCGLDSRYDRISHNDADWYDVDFPDVMDLRRHFYEDTPQYHMIASSVTQPDWIGAIPVRKHCIVIAEGLFMYLTEDEIKTLVARLTARFGRFALIFDAYSTLTARHAMNHPALKKIGARIQWGVDDPKALEIWGLQLLEQKYFTDKEAVDGLSPGTRALFRAANTFPAAKKAHRILIYQSQPEKEG